MRLPNYQADLFPFFNRPNTEGRVRVPNNVKIVVGTETFDCSGPILARQSSVLLELLLNQPELYLDQFVGCVEGLLDCVDLLYGADVIITMENVQAMFKFCLLYKIEGVFELCLKWVSEQLVLNNLATFYTMGLFVKSIDVERGGMDILCACKDLILGSSAEDLVRVSKSWFREVMMFLLDKELLPSTLPIITGWVDSEQKVVEVLDKIEEFEPEDAVVALQTGYLPLMTKMNDLCETVPNLKRVNQLQTLLANQMIQKAGCLEPAAKRFRGNSHYVLERMTSKAWRTFGKEELMSLDGRLEHYIYAEILVDWIVVNKPTQQVVDELWNSIKKEELNYHYLYYLAGTIRMHYVIPLPQLEVKGGSLYKYARGLTYCVSDDIRSEFQKSSTSKTVAMDWNICYLGSCHLESRFRTVCKLIDSIPCYELGVEADGSKQVHYHHDTLKHFYLTHEVTGRPVLLSFVTNSMAEVMDEVKESANIRLHCLSIENIG